ncbi:hypothetical protein BDZ90DRAFT_65374 [Jaminaea rosea]|uniref:Uncharacterized protein n=1 Tax=Jaminaea rosea TaxID=1569628 RepID=A0A316UNE7_9BASI|nr:hypothetical protein BDZ90DRAFT_65374 [Jaminaea rosea]PWN25881.1 hypothetical protein BDZ90DRAFT_65374 [Jaminaea rosea]
MHLVVRQVELGRRLAAAAAVCLCTTRLDLDLGHAPAWMPNRPSDQLSSSPLSSPPSPPSSSSLIPFPRSHSPPPAQFVPEPRPSAAHQRPRTSVAAAAAAAAHPAPGLSLSATLFLFGLPVRRLMSLPASPPHLLPLELTAHGFVPASKTIASTSTSFSLPRTPWVGPPPGGATTAAAAAAATPTHIRLSLSPAAPAAAAKTRNTIVARRSHLTIPSRTTSLPTKRILTAVIRNHSRPFSANATTSHSHAAALAAAQRSTRPKNTVRPFSAPSPTFVRSTSPAHFMGAIVNASTKITTHRNQGTMTTSTTTRPVFPMPAPPRMFGKQDSAERPKSSKLDAVGDGPNVNRSAESPVDTPIYRKPPPPRPHYTGTSTSVDSKAERDLPTPPSPRSPSHHQPMFDSVSPSALYIVDKTMKGQGLPNLKFIIDGHSTSSTTGMAVYAWREVIERVCPKLIDEISDDGLLILEGDLTIPHPARALQHNRSTTTTATHNARRMSASSRTSARHPMPTPASVPLLSLPGTANTDNDIPKPDPIPRTQSISQAQVAALAELALNVELEAEAAKQRSPPRAISPSSTPGRKIRARLLSLRKVGGAGRHESGGSDSTERNDSAATKGVRRGSAWWDQLAHQPIVAPPPAPPPLPLPPLGRTHPGSERTQSAPKLSDPSSFSANGSGHSGVQEERKRSLSSLNSLRPKSLLSGAPRPRSSKVSGEGSRSLLKMSSSRRGSRSIHKEGEEGEQDAEEMEMGLIPRMGKVHGELVRVRGCDLETLRALIFYLCTNQVHFHPSATPTGPTPPSPPLSPLHGYTLSLQLSLPSLLHLSHTSLLSPPFLTPSTVLSHLLSPFAQRFPAIRREWLRYARQSWDEVRGSEGSKEVWRRLARGELEGSEGALMELMGGLGVGKGVGV